jgi:hypothetical protein
VTHLAPHHDGTPVERNEHYFQEPEAAIGEIRSMQSSDLGGVPAALAAFLHGSVCTYVGNLGISRHRRRFGRSRNEVLLFAPTIELRVTRDARMRGRAMHTRVSYEFCDSAGVVLFAIRTSVTQGVTTAVTSPIHFAEAAERAYSEYVLRAFDAELNEHGFVRFALNAHESVCVGPAYVEVRAGDKTARLDATMLQSVVVNRGALEIRSEAPSKKEMPAQSIFRIRIEPGHSVHALAVLLQELVGVRMG